MLKGLYVVKNERGGRKYFICILNLLKYWKSVKLKGGVESHCVCICNSIYILFQGKPLIRICQRNHKPKLECGYQPPQKVKVWKLKQSHWQERREKTEVKSGSNWATRRRWARRLEKDKWWLTYCGKPAPRYKCTKYIIRDW